MRTFTKTWALVAVAGLGTLVAAASLSRRGERPPSTGRPAVPVEAVEAQEAPIVEEVEVVGSLAPKLSADLKSEYSGIVREVYVTEWVDVRAGQPLASLDSREPETAAELARAVLLQVEVAETRAKRELERARNLKEVGLMTQQGLDEAGTALSSAEAACAVARAQLRTAETKLAKIVIRAPFAGTVSFRGVNVGDRVENMGSGDPMFRVVDNRLLELTMTVPSARLGAVRVGAGVEFRTDALPGRTFTGRVEFVNPAVEPVSRAARVVAHVRNDHGELRGGLFVKGRIFATARAGVLQIPRSALQGWDVASGSAEVFVVNGEVTERRPIRTGPTAGDAVEVLEGLCAGERVVTRGAFGLRGGDRILLARGN